MGIYSEIANVFKGIDLAIKTKVCVPMVEQNEAERRKLEKNFIPFPMKVYLKFHPNHDYSKDETVPLPKVLYNMCYVQKFTVKQNLLIADIILKYIKAGQPLDTAFRELQRLRDMGSYKRKIFRDVQQLMLESGMRPDDALNEVANGLIEKGLLKALTVGFNANRLEQTLTNYISDTKYRLKNATRVKKALAYPGMCGVLIIGMCIGAKFMVIPQMADAFGGMDKLPPSFNTVIGVADVFLNPLKLIWLVFAFILAKFIYEKSEAIKLFVHTTMLQIPVIGTYVITKDVCMFFRHLYSELDSGIPLLVSHEDACKSLDNLAIKHIFESCREDLEKGTGIGHALNEITYIGEDIRTMLAVSEKTGDLNSALQDCIVMLQEQYEAVTDTFVESIPMISMLCAGVAIMTIFMPVMFSLYNIDDYI